MSETQICLRQFSEIELSLQTPTIMFAAKLLLVLGSLTVLPLRGGSAGAVCGQRSTYPTIQALPGKPGKNGAPGAPGPKGEPGVDGADGEQGPVGPVGPQGIAGMNGTDGEQGPVGPVGPQGPVGPVGPQGIAGTNGTDGEQGPVGPQGPAGPVGPQGIAGTNGTDGEQGPVGPVGPQGSVGPVGPQGIAGMNGTDGEQGPVGPVGPQGPVGAPGLDGRNGSDGSPGPPGTVPDAVIEQLRAGILEEVLKLLPCKGFFINNPATSCKEIHDCDPTAPSGYYWVRNATGNATQVFCEMNTTNCGNITGGWMRAAHLDMTNENNTCPQGLNYTIVSSTRMCTRSHTDYINCSSVTFPTHGVPYTKVCGRARGYQYSAPVAFYNYHKSDHFGQRLCVRSVCDLWQSSKPHLDLCSWTFQGPQRPLL